MRRDYGGDGVSRLNERYTEYERCVRAGRGARGGFDCNISISIITKIRSVSVTYVSSHQPTINKRTGILPCSVPFTVL
jgi:hypothetical protein